MDRVRASADSRMLCQWMAKAIGDPPMRRLDTPAGTAEKWACVVSDTNPDFRTYLVVWRQRPPAGGGMANGVARLSDLGTVLGWRTVARARTEIDEIAASTHGAPIPESQTPCSRFAETDLAALTVVLLGYNPDHAMYAVQQLPVGAVATASGMLPLPKRTDFPWQTFANALCVQIAAKRRAAQDGWEWQLGRGTQAPDKTGTLGRCLAAPGCTVLINPAGTAAEHGWFGRPAKPVESIFARRGTGPPLLQEVMRMPGNLHHSQIGDETSEVGVPVNFRPQQQGPPGKVARR